MVSQTPSAGDSSAQATTDVSEPHLGSGPGAPSLGDDGTPASSRPAAVRHSFAGQRRSAQVVTLHLASWGRNIERAYASAFNVWPSWGASLSPTIAEVLQFLSYHYGQGSQYRTVTGYRSALSQTLPPVKVLLVVQHPLVCRQLRGICNQRPPLPHYQATRDVRKVLDLLCKCGPSPQLALPQLTRKTAMLLALTGARRCSDVHLLGVSSLRCSVNIVTFSLVGSAKNQWLGQPAKMYCLYRSEVHQADRLSAAVQ